MGEGQATVREEQQADKNRLKFELKLEKHG